MADCAANVNTVVHTLPITLSGSLRTRWLARYQGGQHRAATAQKVRHRLTSSNPVPRDAGYAMPHLLTALMGGSGAGKTTLMDVLAGRKTQGVIHGECIVNGRPKQQETWARVVGYVEQADIHSAGLTVEESLEFSAALRLTSDVSAEMRRAYVLEVLLVTELLDIRGNLIGESGVDGLSPEQRRRLSIGVELVANPSVVVHPTSADGSKTCRRVDGSVCPFGPCVAINVCPASVP
jgi:ABC-type transport system involved in cytochrome bd biosynthesis fused ATPase/permease subunit